MSTSFGPSSGGIGYSSSSGSEASSDSFAKESPIRSDDILDGDIDEVLQAKRADEDIVEARNYSWGSAVLTFLYRELCNASTKGKSAIGGALQLLQIWAWSRIIPLCPGLGAPRVHMGQHSTDNNRLLQAAPYGAMWNLEMHHPERVLRQFGMMQNIPDQLDTRDMSLHKITRSNRTGTNWILQHIHYITRWQRRYDMVIQRQPISNRRDTDRGYWEWYNNITHHFVSSSTKRRVESEYQPVDAPVLQIVTQQVNTLEVLFQSTPVDIEGFDIGFGINQPYAPEYNISPVPFPSFSAYRDNVESNSATSSSGLHINSSGDDNDEQNEPIQNMTKKEKDVNDTDVIVDEGGHF
ncbi:protein MAIN-LIKE 1 [Sesamum angolense]|uniref:Protein MAIN-LIKE 1 n=1 Tax=Sesamum angolense TaxID=2727404 RepID=A0AAE2BUJ0_9LAMI|nr:protein MAIN-LIKE 1 [Sesamum angolense]